MVLSVLRQLVSLEHLLIYRVIFNGRVNVFHFCKGLGIHEVLFLSRYLFRLVPLLLEFKQVLFNENFGWCGENQIEFIAFESPILNLSLPLADHFGNSVNPLNLLWTQGLAQRQMRRGARIILGVFVNLGIFLFRCSRTKVASIYNQICGSTLRHLANMLCLAQFRCMAPDFRVTVLP